jgi:AraC-like DNA-binding protein
MLPQAKPVVCGVELALRVRVWDLGQDRLMVAGSFGDLAVHHHPAVQVTVGVEGPVMVTRADGGRDSCRLVVVASGTRHAVRSDARSAAVSIYLGPATPEGIALNALSHTRGQHKGVWVVGAGEQLANATAAAMAAGGPRAAANFLVHALSGKSSGGSDRAPLVHPQLRQALELVTSSAPGDIRFASVAAAVALSPDYLGRLCKQQTGLSFSATTRWVRLLAGLRYLAEGGSVTDAAHLAGFADGSHANRACWEMAGWPPSAFARALNDSRMVSPPAV